MLFFVFPDMEKLSAVILTFNEERNIARCISSLGDLPAEVLVVDSFSTDKTVAICESMGARVIQHPFEGYIEQKNYAAHAASHNLVLSLDADEALSEELLNSIKQTLRDRMHDVYSMNRLTNYCGRWIRHSGWYPDTKIRLFDRTKGQWGGVNPHDKYMPAAGATTGKLTGDILHYSYYTIDEHKAQVERFAKIAARALYEKGERSGYLKLLYKPVARFIKTYFIKGGILDGKEGWIIAVQTARSSWLRYSLLMKIQNQPLA